MLHGTLNLFGLLILNTKFYCSSYQARKAGSILMVSKDGYYNHQLCLDDFKKASWIVKKKTGKKSIFVTDHSPIHKAMGQDSLDASKMNKVNVDKLKARKKLQQFPS